jgi:NAD(P)H-hydrate epimerase
MARLTGRALEDIARSNWELALEFAARWQQVVVQKGPHTAIATPGGTAWVFGRPNPGLATAGSGDVLAGLIAGLAAQGLAPVDAARLAVVVHGLTAGAVLDRHGWRSLLASDLVAIVPEVLASLAR